MFCAFRLYGDFVWPPKPDTADGPDRREGLIEIYFDRLDPPGAETGRLRAFLRWRPGKVVPSAHEALPAAPAPEQTIFEIEEPHHWFAQHSDSELAVWIHGYDGKLGGEVLAFRGAFLFEQTAPDGSTTPLRWPLVRNTAYGGGLREALSELVIGQPPDPKHPDTKDNFRFNLQLPTLVPQTRIGDEAVPVLPFSVLYNSHVATPEAATRFDTMTAGPRGAAFIIRGQNEPRVQRLGAFGFAPQRGGAASDFAGYGDAPGGELDTYWPGSKTTDQCLALLSAIGIDTTGAGPGRPRLLRDGPTEMSFTPRPGPEAGPPGGRFTTRLSFAPPSSKGSAGALFWRDSHFYLRLEEELGGFLKFARLHLDCIAEVEIADAAIWSGYSAWSCRLRLRPHWEGALKAGSLGEEPSETFMDRPVFGVGILPDGARAMRMALADLYRIEAAQPQSFLPDLSVPATQRPRLALYAPPVSAQFTAMGTIDFARRPPVTQRTPLRLSLLDDHDLIAPEQPQVVQLEARLPSFFTQAPGALPFHLRHDAAWAAMGDWQDGVAGPPYFASFAIGTPKGHTPADWSGRLAGIEFAARAAPLDAKDGHLRLGGKGVGNRGTRPVPGVSGFPHPLAVELHYDLPFTEALPVGVDARRGVAGERAAPLLIGLDNTVDGSCGDGLRFRLSVTEYLAPVGDRLLQVDVFEDTTETGDRTYVVLSEEPFSINRFASRVLGGRGGAESGSVAAYSSDRRSWEFRRAAEYYHYSFPPQVVGESADKPRRLELHDVVKGRGAPAVAGAPLPPYQANPKDPKDSLRRHAVEFRLTPSAEIWIRPSDVERGYFTPEWNSHDIFRQRGELGLGAALAWLRAEFLYGLPVGIEVGKERGASRRARVAEIEALTGTTLGSAGTGSALAERWNGLSRALARRPERLEVWADDPNSVLDFAPARFRDGASFALRETALLRAPVLRKAPAEPTETVGHHPALPKRLGHLRYHPQGLSGGALWPVESNNLFDALAEKPWASGGEIENIALSPLGGDAVQKAIFLDGKVSIITRTRNGHIENQQTEVIGRIGALWHRAKHVVVYGRAVNPSAQFAPTYDEDSQRTRTRRPVLRKLHEYIELLQPERAYPDFSQASARSAGFLDRVRFNGRIINVDSAWSRDVGDYGWEIPLWNRKASRQRPQVYPMPDVAFVSVAEGEGERPLLAQECRDPDNLYFFADFETPGADTDAWPQRPGVDYANLPSANVIAAVHDRRSAEPDGTGGRRRPPVSRVLPGARRFTWRLAASPRKVALNAGRSAKPLYVGLDSISFMRASPGANADLFAPFGELLAASAGAAAAATGQSPDYWGANSSKAIFETADAFSQAVAALRRALDGNEPPDVIEAARGALGQALDALAAGAPAKVGQVASGVTEALRPVRDKAKGVQGVIDKGKADCDRLTGEALDAVRRKALLVEAVLREWEADIGAVLDELDTPGSKQALIDHFVPRIITACRPAFDDAAGGVADIGERVEQVRAILDDGQAEADAAIARTLARVREHAASYDRDKPWSEERRRAFYLGLESAAAGAADDILAAIEEARQRLATEVDDIGQRIAGHVGAALRATQVGQQDALSKLASFHGTAAKVLTSARSALVPALPPGEPGSGKLDELLQRLPDIRQRIGNSAASAPLKQRALAAITGLEQAAGRIQALAVEAVALIDAAASYGDDFDRRLTAAISRVSAVLHDAARQVVGRVEELAAIANAMSAEAQEEAGAALKEAQAGLRAASAGVEAWAGHYLERVGQPIDAMATGLVDGLVGFAADLRAALAEAGGRIDEVAGDVADAVAGAQAMLAPGAVFETIAGDAVVRPALTTLLAPLPENFDAAVWRDEILSWLSQLSAAIAEAIRTLDAGVAAAIGDVSAICNLAFEGAAAVEDYLDGIIGDAENYALGQIGEARSYLENLLKADLKDLEGMLGNLKAVDLTIRNLQNDLARSLETAGAYGNRVLEAAGRLDDGGLLAAPSNILKLYSATTSAPEIAALKADIDRLRANFDELNDIIKTTRANALFDRLGDELKALGLTLPFDSVSDRLLPVDLSSFDISRVFRNFGGLQFDRLFRGYKLPAGVRDAVRITHDFDKKQARAWVQVDIDAAMPGRRSLFSLGLFQADFVDMRLTGQVRFEVSKDSDTVTQTGHGRIGTMVDLVVSGQSMVLFEKFGLNFTKESGLDIEFDPKNIRINPAFRFIQEFLATLFPDEAGGLNVIKQDGIPVGLEHEFAIPPLSLNFATSGVSNIAITNRFQLLAYPDFVLANRFNLSRPERPFIFSIFVIGGTGYVQVDAEYRPFDNALMVAVEAAAGGSASLAFAFGPFSGQVFITLSVALTYRKLIGRSGGGLSVGVVLVIAGYVNVAGIVTIGIVLMLRMTYRDSGQIDADGTLSVTIRISRFFKITARAGVQYTLRGGKSETSTSKSLEAEPEGQLAQAASKLRQARG